MESPSMKFSSRREGDVVVFDLKGGLEGGPDSYEIKQAVTDMLGQGDRKFLINLDDVDFVNSTGIGIIASVFSTISNAKGVMKICNANEKVSRVMMITKLLEVFDSHRHEEDALKAFQSA
jgi:anti-sigma B factor antagonist